MADEGLRELERASRDDPAAAHAYAQALLRARERERATWELLRLARLGDATARALLAPPLRALRSTFPRGVHADLGPRWLEDVLDGWALVSARTVTPERFELIALDDLSSRWQRGASAGV